MSAHYIVGKRVESKVISAHFQIVTDMRKNMFFTNVISHIS